MRLTRPVAMCLAVMLVAGGVVACASVTDRSMPPATLRVESIPATDPPATPHPAPGHEVFGFVPYWEMDDGIAAHLRATPLTTLALFSVTSTNRGAINARKPGYRAVTGPVGERLIREAHERGSAVQIVFSSFGFERNRRLLSNAGLQDATIASLVELTGELGIDGVNVDVESLDPTLVPAYGSFVGRLRDAVVAADAGDEVSVATSAGATGAAMAVAAATAGADRVFMMGYDYRVSGSSPGASAPLERSDGEERDLRWSLDLYAALGVPPQRTVLGLPLYGMAWPVAGPVVGAPQTGPGETWVPRRNLDLLGDPSIVPVRDEIEAVEVYLLASDGTIGPPSPGVSPPHEGEARTWRAVYVDSPATLAPKLALADERGLAGAGFWAIGYERGLPGYTDLISRFAAGDLSR